jgi:predicted thioesterase
MHHSWVPLPPAEQERPPSPAGSREGVGRSRYRRSGATGAVFLVRRGQKSSTKRAMSRCVEHDVCRLDLGRSGPETVVEPIGGFWTVTAEAAVHAHPRYRRGGPGRHADRGSRPDARFLARSGLELLSCCAVLVEPGARAEVKLTVGDGDTAVALGSGDVPVLGTPRVVALCEEATVAAVAGRLDSGCTSVGMRIQLDHLQPNAVGSTVAAEAVLEKVEGRKLLFTVSVRDHRGLVACGKVTRVVVDADRFLEKT